MRNRGRGRPAGATAQDIGPVGEVDDLGNVPTSASPPDTTGEDDPVEQDPRPASLGAVARTVGSALFGRDLLLPRPPLWPFGDRARTNRRTRREILDRARTRRAALWQHAQATPTRRPVAAGAAWRPVARGRHLAVVTTLLVIVGAVFALAWRFDATARPSTPPARDPATTTATTAPTTPDTPASWSPATAAGAPSAAMPIPRSGVAAISPPGRAATDPASVPLVAPPTGVPSAAELASPDGAVRAWLARTCPFDWRDGFGVAQTRGRSAMTPAGWQQADPTRDPQARASWAHTVAAHEMARCGAPSATIDPETPRTDTSAVVLGTILRVVAGPDDTSYVEPLTWTGWVQRGPDGLWRVDIATTGG